MTTTYCSTRGKEAGLHFEHVVLGGLATDGGLYVPEKVPELTLTEIEKVTTIFCTSHPLNFN